MILTTILFLIAISLMSASVLALYKDHRRSTRDIGQHGDSSRFAGL